MLDSVVPPRPPTIPWGARSPQWNQLRAKRQAQNLFMSSPQRWQTSEDVFFNVLDLFLSVIILIYDCLEGVNEPVCVRSSFPHYLTLA